MALFDTVSRMMALAPWDHQPLQTRSDPPPEGSLADFIARIQGERAQPWRAASVTEALSVPSIFAAVTLISNVTGSLSMLAYRNGAQLADDERPRLIVRPNPFTTPREFYRETAYSMACYGEAWWWVAARDFDDSALSLLPVHPKEIIVTENDDDLRFPIIEWRGRRMPNRDMIQIKMTGEPGALRGRGPLQMCGAAVSVAVEAQEWAANFFSEDGGIPSIVIKSATELTQDEAEALRDQWMNKPHNQPRFIDNGIESVDEFGANTQGSQMLQARSHNDINDARMFNIPGPLLDAVQSGSSITYQNREGLWGEFLERCLLPNYLEPIEQVMSDQLTRSTVSRFSTKGLLRADIKTRFEVHKTAIESGIYDANTAAIEEGYEAGDIENAPMPLSPPAAVPTLLPIQGRSRELREIRCPGKVIIRGLFSDCDRKLGMVEEGASYEFVCGRCKTVAASA